MMALRFKARVRRKLFWSLLTLAAVFGVLVTAAAAKSSFAWFSWLPWPFNQ